MIHLPEIFAKRTGELLGGEYPLFERALQEEPSLSVRVNDKMPYQPSDARVAWCEQGFYLNEQIGRAHV